MRYRVPDMTCGHCVRSLRDAFDRHLPGVTVDIDLTKREVSSETADPEALAKAVRAAGYEIDANT
jgi:copper chaperone